MRLLVVHAHPAPESYGAALRDTAIEAARAAGHEVRLIDLAAEGFDPVMRADEWRGYADPAALPADLAAHVVALRWAEGVVFTHPIWWGAQPAILRGWLDRVWRPGIAFLTDGATGLRPGFANIRLIGVVTTLGAPWWVWTFVLGAPGRRIMLRALRACTARRTRTFWLALHGIDGTTDPQRQAFLARVRARIGRIPR